MAIVHQAVVVWMFTDEKRELSYELSQFIEAGEFGGGAANVMPYNEAVLEQIVASGLWEK